MEPGAFGVSDGVWDAVPTGSPVYAGPVGLAERVWQRRQVVNGKTSPDKKIKKPGCHLATGLLKIQIRLFTELLIFLSGLIGFAVAVVVVSISVAHDLSYDGEQDTVNYF